jgi:hypothetical protein
MSTLTLATALHDAIADALDPMPGGHYRAEDEQGNAEVPSWWIHADNSASLNDTQDLNLLTLDIWHVSLGDLADALDAVAFLKVHTAGRVTYRRQSVTVLHEEQNVHHASILLGATDWSS